MKQPSQSVVRVFALNINLTNTVMTHHEQGPSEFSGGPGQYEEFGPSVVTFRDQS